MRRSETGILSQFATLFLRNGELFFRDKKKLISSLLVPVVIGTLVVIVCREKFMDNYEDTGGTIYAIISVAIYLGMFNSLFAICKERRIIKREYMTNMRLVSYVTALAAFQLFICLAQSAIYMVIYWIQMDFPTGGLVIHSGFWEYLISLFLVVYVSDLMGMVISAASSSSEMAILVAPVVIAVQMVFSGVYFALSDNAKKVSVITVSKWGMEAMGSTARLNGLELMVQKAFPMVPHEADSAFTATAAHVTHAWGVMGLFILVFLVLCIIILKGVEKDGR